MTRIFIWKCLQKINIDLFQLSDAGGRLIIASDGIWDALSSDAAAKACRGLPADLAAKLVVKVELLSWISFLAVYFFLLVSKYIFISPSIGFCIGSLKVKGSKG